MQCEPNIDVMARAWDDKGCARKAMIAAMIQGETHWLEKIPWCTNNTAIAITVSSDGSVISPTRKNWQIGGFCIILPEEGMLTQIQT